MCAMIDLERTRGEGSNGCLYSLLLANKWKEGIDCCG
jgi:hypothetical protein